jgi:predicted phage tail protein
MDGDLRFIQGSGGGGGKGAGGASRAAKEDPNTLQSNAIARIVEILGEGEIVGLVTEDGTPCTPDNYGMATFLDETVVQNSDGSANFNGIAIEQRVGLPTQEPLYGIEGVETEIVVGGGNGVEVRSLLGGSGYLINTAAISGGVLTVTTRTTSDGAAVPHGLEVGDWIGVGHTDDKDRPNHLDGYYQVTSVPNPTTVIADATGKDDISISVTIKGTDKFDYNNKTYRGTNYGDEVFPQPKFGLSGFHVATINDVDFDAVRVTMRVPGLTTADPKTGDLHGNVVAYDIQVSTDDGPYETVLEDIIEGKCTGVYERAFRVTLPKPAVDNWKLRIFRATSDAERTTEQKSLFLSRLTGIIDNKLIYPNVALIGLIASAQEFGGTIPSRAYRIRGLIIQVPENYDPETRTYTGMWSGDFKYAWTNNPAWVYYALATNRRYGLGEYIRPEQIDKWSLYQIAQYCDELVDDGFGGQEPRFTFNHVFTTRAQAYDTLMTLSAAFRGMVYWSNGAIIPVQDAPSDPVMIVSPANVIDGTFTYQGTALTSRHSVVFVSWTDPNDFYRPNIEIVEDPDLLQRYGWKQTDITAVGCTSRGQARRLGRWVLESVKSEKQVVTYRCGLDHMRVMPGSVIAVADPAIADIRYGGRLVETTGYGTDQTNYIRNSIADGGNAPSTLPANWSSTQTGSGITLSVIGTGTTDSGLEYIDIRLSGVATGATTQYDLFFEGNTQIAAAAGETWAGSVYVHAIAGSVNNIQQIKTGVFNYTAGGALINEVWGGDALTQVDGATKIITRGPLRPQAVATLSGGTTAHVNMGLRVSYSAAAVDVTLRIVGPQLQENVYPTKYIRTAGAAATEEVPSQTHITVDEAISLQGDDVVSVVMSDGSVVDRPVDYLPAQTGNQTTFIVSSAFPEAPRAGSMWAISSSVVETRKFRVSQIRQSEPNIFEITATEHDPNKYARVEEGISFVTPSFSLAPSGPIKAPTNIVTEETIYRVNNQVRTRFTISWRNPGDSRINYYEVYARRYLEGGVSSENWTLVTNTPTFSTDMYDIAPGLYDIRIRSRSVLGFSTYTTLEQVNVVGKSAPPADVANLTAHPEVGGVTLQWDEVTDIDLIGYDVREGDSWDTATPVSVRMKGTILFIGLSDTGSHTYLVRSIDDSGNYSTNVASVTTSVAAPDSISFFDSYSQEGTIHFRWDTVSGVDVEYEVRVGGSWDLGQVVFRSGGNNHSILYPTTSLTTFWIKAVSKLGVYSSTARGTQVYAETAENRNLIITKDLNSETFPGTKRNMTYDAGTDTLAVDASGTLPNLYGNYFYTLDLAASPIRARNWLEAELLLMDANSLIWDDATFTWDSDTARDTAWLSSGEGSGASARVEISPQTGLTAEDVEGFTLNSTLTGLDATAPSSSSGIAYGANLINNGLVINQSTQAAWSVTTPSTFTVGFRVKVNGPVGATYHTLLKFVNGGNWLSIRMVNGAIIVDDSANGQNTLSVNPSYAEGEEYMSVVFTQGSGSRILAAAGTRSHVAVSATAAVAPVSSWTSVRTYA